MQNSQLVNSDAIVSTQITTGKLRDDQAELWAQFVDAHPLASFFHSLKWGEVLERVLGHEMLYVYALQDDFIVGILPLVRMKSLLFGSSLSSLGFCASAGPLVTESAALKPLLLEACRLADNAHVDALEIRSTEHLSVDWPEKLLYVNFRKVISDDHDQNMQAIPRKQRAMVRKSLKKGLLAEETKSLDRFYRVYSTSVRNLGTPVFSKQYFQALCETFGDQCRMLMVKHGNNDVATVMSFYFRDQVLPYYAGSLPEGRSLHANDFMYWELMCRSVDEGVRVFDYGRSKKGTGSFSFKKNWGFIPEQLYYQYHLVKANTIPATDPTNPKYAAFIKAWKHLPLPIANTLGPFLSRTLG